MSMQLDHGVDDALMTKAEPAASNAPELGSTAGEGVLRPQLHQSNGSPHTRRLVLSAVLHGLVLDDPWRHAYLRRRWTRIDGKEHHGHDD